MLPKASQHFPWGTRERRVYDLLACGPQTGIRIARMMRIRSVKKVVAEIRRRIDGTGVTIKTRPVNGHKQIVEYRLAKNDVEVRP